MTIFTPLTHACSPQKVGTEMAHAISKSYKGIQKNAWRPFYTQLYTHPLLHTWQCLVDRLKNLWVSEYCRMSIPCWHSGNDAILHPALTVIPDEGHDTRSHPRIQNSLSKRLFRRFLIPRLNTLKQRWHSYNTYLSEEAFIMFLYLSGNGSFSPFHSNLQQSLKINENYFLSLYFWYLNFYGR